MFDTNFTYTVAEGTISEKFPAGVSVTLNKNITPARIVAIGMSRGQEVVLFIRRQREGFNVVHSNSIDGKSLPPDLVPVFRSPSGQGDNLFNVYINNYNPSYTWAVKVTPLGSATATITLDSSGYYIKIELIDPTKNPTFTVSTSREIIKNNVTEMFSTGTKNITTTDLTSTLKDPLTATFGPVTSTDGGFTVKISNYGTLINNGYTITFSASLTTPQTQISMNTTTTNLIIVSELYSSTAIGNVATNKSSTVTVKTHKAGHKIGESQIVGTASIKLNPALIPTIGDYGPSKDNDTVWFIKIANYNSNYSWSCRDTTTDTRIVCSIVPSAAAIKVSNFSRGTIANLEIKATRYDYYEGIKKLSITNPYLGLTPTFQKSRLYKEKEVVDYEDLNPLYQFQLINSKFYSESFTPTLDGFTAQVNYDRNYTWTVKATSGTVTITNTGLVRVTGLTGLGKSSTVTITTSRAGYTTVITSITGKSRTTSPPLGTDIIVGNKRSMSNGRGVGFDIINVDKEAGDYFPDTVWGFSLVGSTKSIDVVSSIHNLYAYDGATPDFKKIYKRQNDGTYNITIFIYQLENKLDLLNEDALTVTITALGTYYGRGITSAYKHVKSINVLAGITEEIGVIRISQTDDGFTFLILNFDKLYNYTIVCPDISSAVVQSIKAYNNTLENYIVTIAGIYPGIENIQTVITKSRPGTNYAPVTKTIYGSSKIGQPLVPTFGSRSSTQLGFIVPISNYDPDFSYSATVKRGSPTANLAKGSEAVSIVNRQVIVSGLGINGRQATAIVTTTRNKGKSLTASSSVSWTSLGGPGKYVGSASTTQIWFEGHEYLQVTLRRFYRYDLDDKDTLEQIYDIASATFRGVMDSESSDIKIGMIGGYRSELDYVLLLRIDNFRYDKDGRYLSKNIVGKFFLVTLNILGLIHTDSETTTGLYDKTKFGFNFTYYSNPAPSPPPSPPTSPPTSSISILNIKGVLSTSDGVDILLDPISGSTFVCTIDSIRYPDPYGSFNNSPFLTGNFDLITRAINSNSVIIRGLAAGQRVYITIKAETNSNRTIVTHKRSFYIQALPPVLQRGNSPILANMRYISSSDFESIMANPKSFKDYIDTTKLASPDYKRQISHNMPFGGYLIYYIGTNDISGIDLAKSLKIGLFSKQNPNQYITDLGVDFTSPITPQDGSPESTNYPGGYRCTTNGMFLPWYLDEQPSTAPISPHPCFVNPPRTILAGGRIRPNCLTLVNISSYNHENIYYPLNFNDSDNKLLWDNSDPLYNGRIYVMKLGDFEKSQIQDLMFKQEQRFQWSLCGKVGPDGVTPISPDPGRPEKDVRDSPRLDLDGVCIFNDRITNNGSVLIEKGDVCITFTPDITKATKPYGGYQLWKLPYDWETCSYYSSFKANKVVEIGLNGCITFFPDIGPPTKSGCGNQNPNPRMN